MLFRFCTYGFLKNQRYHEIFFILILMRMELAFVWIGMLMAVRDWTVNILEIPSGAIADAWGRRGSMIASFVAYIVCFAIFAMTDDWWMLVLAMVMHGFGDSFRTGTHKAMIFEWLRINDRQSERTRIYGLTRSWSKIGSAVSAIIAAVLVIVTQDYRMIFVFAIVPYALNIVNFLGYPSELDGTHERQVSIKSAAQRMFASAKNVVHSKNLRGLVSESMRWDGVFQAIKDYLQPVLAALVIAMLAIKETDDVRWQSPALIGGVYFVMFILAGWASRQAHRFVDHAGGEQNATRRIWMLTFAVYVSMIIADLCNVLTIVAIVFVLLHVLQNLWRPILISRFDDQSEADEGATVLSIESQSQRLATSIIAPLVGLMLDAVIHYQLPGQFWPIGIVGALATLSVVVGNRLKA